MTFDPNDKRYLDNLFDMTSRGPFSGYNPDQIGEETSQIDTGLGSIADDTRWPLYSQGYIFASCYNDQFDAAPPLGVTTVLSDLINKLPGWTLVDGTTDSSAVVTYEQNAAGSGQLKFETGDGVLVGDRVYVEQLVYMPTANIRLFNFAMRAQLTEAASGFVAGVDWDMFIEVAWVQNNGSTSATVEKHFSPGDDETGLVRMWWSSPPADTTYAKVKIGIELLSTTNLSGVKEAGYIYGANFTRPEVQWATQRFSLGRARAEINLPDGVASYLMESQGIITHEDAGKFLAPAPGFYMGFTAQTDTIVTTGDIDFQPTINGTPVTDFGFKLGHNVDGALDYPNYATMGRLIEADDYDFLNGDTVQMTAVTGTNWTEQTQCIVVTLHIALIWHEFGASGVTEDHDAIQYKGG